MPEASVVTDDLRRTMALKMSDNLFPVGCQSAKPKGLFGKGDARFKHPNDNDVKGKYIINSLFEILTQTVWKVKKLRGGLDLSHIGEGIRINSYFGCISSRGRVL